MRLSKKTTENRSAFRMLIMAGQWSVYGRNTRILCSDEPRVVKVNRTLIAEQIKNWGRQLHAWKSFGICYLLWWVILMDFAELNLRKTKLIHLSNISSSRVVFQSENVLVLARYSQPQPLHSPSIPTNHDKIFWQSFTFPPTTIAKPTHGPAEGVTFTKFESNKSDWPKSCSIADSVSQLCLVRQRSWSK